MCYVGAFNIYLSRMTRTTIRLAATLTTTATLYNIDLIIFIRYKLLAPNREAAQVMLQVCEEFAAKSNILFSTDPDPKKSKSKALYVVGPRGAALARPAPHCSCVAAPCPGW